MKIYYNGNIIDSDIPFINHKDCGFTTGIGIFDSMLAENGKPVHIIEHFERIMHDSETIIGTKPNLSFKSFCGSVAHLIASNAKDSPYARIRTTVTGGIVESPLEPVKNPHVLIDVAPCSKPDNSPITCAIITDYPRVSDCEFENCKRLDYSRSYAARRAAEALGAQEAILTNTDGNISCGATSNIFIKENGVLITPPLSDGVLAGVTRKKIIEKNKVHEESVSPQRLKKAQKAFLTNSFMNLREIKKIN